MSKATAMWRALAPAVMKGDEFAVEARKGLVMAVDPEAADKAADYILAYIATFLDPDLPPCDMTYVSRITWSCLVDSGLNELEAFLKHPSNQNLDE